MSASRKQMLIDLYLSGLSAAEAGRQLGYSKSSAHTTLRRLGLTRQKKYRHNMTVERCTNFCEAYEAVAEQFELSPNNLHQAYRHYKTWLESVGSEKKDGNK